MPHRAATEDEQEHINFILHCFNSYKLKYHSQSPVIHHLRKKTSLLTTKVHKATMFTYALNYFKKQNELKTLSKIDKSIIVKKHDT